MDRDRSDGDSGVDPGIVCRNSHHSLAHAPHNYTHLPPPLHSSHTRRFSDCPYKHLLLASLAVLFAFPVFMLLPASPAIRKVLPQLNQFPSIGPVTFPCPQLPCN